jgi:hypothetical protein
MSTANSSANAKKTTAVIYGTLSETVVPVSGPSLPSQLAALQRRFGYLVNDYREQRLSRREFKQALVTLTETDASGNEWTIGARTGQFYRRTSSTASWQQSDPAEFDLASSKS